ncbi:MAG: hypothetical protein JWO68_3208 [Actinomycetia bacterium]|nr:hypothetical protein [Actinomycetes bacterium]
MTLRIQAIDIDANDTDALATFWSDLLGWERKDEGDGEISIWPPDRSAPPLLLLQVPEGKQVKNRLHLDLRPDDQDAEVARALALGATRVDIGQGDVTWVVLADPEGNEFCILRRLTADEVAAGET